jgi:hypothetical protein
MAALPPYVPTKDALFSNWLDNFATLLAADPALYGLTAGDAATVTAQQVAWAAAYGLVTSPSTKTAEAVSAKNDAKINALGVVRPLAQRISLNAGVASSDKVAIGVNPRTSTPSPITPPTSQPVLLVQSASSLSLILRYRDSAASVSVKAKPYGVTQLRLYGKTSATPITDPAELPLIETLTKSPAVLSLAAFSPGAQLYLVGRWATRTGGLSDPGAIINFTVPVGG